MKQSGDKTHQSENHVCSRFRVEPVRREILGPPTNATIRAATPPVLHKGRPEATTAGGVIIVPRVAERSVLELAWQKTMAENHTREALEQGALLADMYAKYGVL